MAIQNLKDVYTDQLADLWSACSQSREATMSLSRAAKSSELREALDAGVEGIQSGMTAVKELAETHGFDAEGEHCMGMEGIVKEVRAHALEEEFGDEDAQDAMIISQYQRMAHYAIAGWGCCEAFARRLGLEDDAAKLKECLESTKGGDVHMTELATGGINAAAA
jgi:ferritin-like metal-binding protein YciE